MEFVNTRAVPLLFMQWDPGHAGRARPAHSLALYLRYVRAYVSLCVTNVVVGAGSAAGLELRTACFARYAWAFAPHAHVAAALVAVVSMLHGRLGAGSAGQRLDADCLRLVCAQLLAPPENAGSLLPARAASLRR